MISNIIVQTARTDIFKHIIKMISGKIEYIPFTFDNTKRSLSIIIKLEKISYYAEFKDINYFNINCDKNIYIVPIKIQNLESMYKSLGSSKIKSLQMEYIYDKTKLFDKTEKFIFSCNINDSSTISKDMDIIRDDNMILSIDSHEDYSHPTILNSDAIILFDRTIAEIDKSHSNKFLIHYTDGNFYIKYNNNPVIFGFQWQQDTDGLNYIMSQRHKCDSKCQDIYISKTYCKKVLNKLKSLNRNQICLSFKYIHDNLSHIKITHNLDEIGTLCTIINCTSD